jgi:hypothetical protein
MIGEKLRVLTYYKEWKDSNNSVVASHSKYEDLEVVGINREIFYEEENTTKYELIMDNGMMLNFFTDKELNLQS